MPNVARQSVRMDCAGIDLVHPLDRMPPGYFGYLINARVTQEGILEGRPGYAQAATTVANDTPNSIRRLNDPAQVYNPAGYIYVGGCDTKLYAGQETSYASRDTGYSGYPLSLIPFRPEQSPVSWMYVYDANKMVKMRADLAIRAVGVAPPSAAPAITYAAPANVDIVTGQEAAGSWTVVGTSTATASNDRTGGGVTISAILYDASTTGWCCIWPSSTDSTWMGDRMKVILNAAEEVLVREVHKAIPATTITGINYDSGSTGLASLTINGSPPGLARNSLLDTGSEIFRVLDVILSPDGNTYSVRAKLANNYSAGQAIQGRLSWYTYTTSNHAAGEAIAARFIQVTNGSAGVGAIQSSAAPNASIAGGRPVDVANDYLFISLYFANPENVINTQLLICLDSTPNFSFTNPGNSLIFTLTPSDLQIQGASSASWVSLILPLASAARYGNDLTRNLANIHGVSIQVTSSGATDYGYNYWYVGGTYGPTILPNSPVGVIYQTRFREVSTGAKSVPGPLNRQALFPLREGVIITPATSGQTGVDTCDIYRMGGTISSPLYIGSAPNNVGSPQSLTDALPDTAVLETNQPPDINAIQPWPILQVPMLGTCHSVGTSIVIDSGLNLNLNMLGNTVVLINGVAFQTYGQPRSSTYFEVTQSAGNGSGLVIQINDSTIAAQPLPFAFGPLEGPFAPVVFALGDPVNPGVLYFSNFSDADSASDGNTLELAPPSSPLISGAVWNGMAFAGTRDELFSIRYSYLTTIGATGSTSYQWVKIPAPSGIWSRWACCACPVGLAYLGRDGIYIATEAGGVNISDGQLYPLFPHDGQSATTLNVNPNVIFPVDMTQLQYLRLSYCDQELRFTYKDTGGNVNTLVYQIPKKRWLLDNYADPILFHYLVEESPVADTIVPPNNQNILMGAYDDLIMLAGGNTDNGAIINSQALIPAMDGGDERVQKLYVDQMVQAGGSGNLTAQVYYDNAVTYAPAAIFACNGSVQQFIQSLSIQPTLSLYRNIGVKMLWTGGPAGPKIYAWEYSGFVQPYLSTFFVTQFISFSFPGWKHMRRLFPALISNTNVLLSILTQDGRLYGPISIGSTNGQFNIEPMMLPQGIKDLSFSLQLDGQGRTFALFPDDFMVEVKEWTEETYIKLAAFKS